MSRRRTWAALVIAGSVAIAAPVTRAANAPEPTVAGPAMAVPAPIGSVPTDQAAGFAVLRRARRSSDVIDAATRSALDPTGAIARANGLNLDLARAVAVSATSRSWIVPGSDRLCLFAPDGGTGYGGACATTKEALAGQLMLTFEPHEVRRPGDQVRLVGLMPDAATSWSAATKTGAELDPVAREGYFEIVARELDEVEVTLAGRGSVTYEP